jgi:subtilase family serine protease
MSVSKKGAIACVVALTLAAAPEVGPVAEAGASAATPTPLSASVPSWTARDRVVGALPADQSLQIRVWLAPNTAGATALANAVSNPRSPSYRHYLTPSQYTGQFGPSAASASAVASWLRSSGLGSVSVDGTRAYVSATGSTATVERVFRVRENIYQPAGGVQAAAGPLYANDRAPSIPAGLTGDVLGVTGLDNVSPASTLMRSPVQKPKSSSGPPTCSNYYGQYDVTVPTLLGATSYSLTPCGYSASQLRSVYSMNTTNIGTGVTVAVIEQGLATDMFQTLGDYAKTNGLPAPSASRYEELSISSGPGGSKCGDPFALEEQLDVEMTYDMAYGAKILVVGGDPCITAQEGLPALFAADQLVLDGHDNTPLASVVSNSWDLPEALQTNADTNIEHAILLQAASEGVSMLYSAGDAPGVDAPSNDPYATAIGGTTVGIGQTGQALFTTGWSDQAYGLLTLPKRSEWFAEGIDGAGGGGATPYWAQPKYQYGIVPRSMATLAGNRPGLVRVVPDISASANEFTPVLVGLLQGKTYVTEAVGGTSEASPLIAGMLADAEQGTTSTLGFLNPALYGLSGSSAITDVLGQNSATASTYRADLACFLESNACEYLGAQFEYQKPVETLQVTQPGYDNMTGLGTPNGQSFLTALHNL